MDSAISSLRGSFANLELDRRYDAMLDRHWIIWSRSFGAYLSLLLPIVGFCREKSAAMASPLHTLIMFASLSMEYIFASRYMPFTIGRRVLIPINICLHRSYQIAYIFHLVDWSPLASTYLESSGPEYVINTLLLGGILVMGLPLNFPQTILSRVAIEGIGAIFALQVRRRQGFILPIAGRIMSRFALSVAIGFLNDWLRRIHFLRAFAVEQRAEMAARELPPDNKRMPCPSPYKPVMRTERAIVRITSGQSHDLGVLMTAMQGEATKQHIREEINSHGLVMLEYSTRPGSVILEIEAYVPTGDPGGVEADNDVNGTTDLMDYSAWLKALKLQEVGNLADGTIVSVSIRSESRLFSYDKARDTWTPHHPSNLSPLVPLMTSLLSRMGPCCTSLSRSPETMNVAFHAIWLEDNPLHIGSLREVGIHLDATMAGMPIPLRLHPALPRDWQKGQTVSVVVQLPPLCPPGTVRVNLWSVDDSSMSSSQRPCMVAASQPFLILPSEAVSMADELNSRSIAQGGIEDLLVDIGRLCAFDNECKSGRNPNLNPPNPKPDQSLVAKMKKVKQVVVDYCSLANLPYTLDFVKSIDVAEGGDLSQGAETFCIGPSPYPLHLLWLWFNVCRYTLHGLQLILTRQKVTVDVALIIYCTIPYLLILVKAPPFSFRPTGGFSHWFLVRNIGLLLCLHKLLMITLTISGYLPPVRGTPYHPEDPASARFWPYVCFMNLLADAMEPCDSMIASALRILIGIPSIFVYGGRVMRIAPNRALFFTVMITASRVLALAVTTGISTKHKHKSQTKKKID